MTNSLHSAGATYRAAGVDMDAAEAIISPFKAAAGASMRPEILSGVGDGFAALSRIPKGYRKPVIVAGTDGVGSKLKLAIQLNAHEGLGQDLVAMSVNDVLVCGAEPLMFLDYFATAKLKPKVATRLVQGIADACQLAGCALAGGETAEMPGLYRPGDYDLAGFCIGIVEESKIIKGDQIKAGDQIIGIGSSGPHANGYSLIRMLLKEHAIDICNQPAISEQLLAPTRIYTDAVRSVIKATKVKGIAHVTGGGITDNLPRMLPEGTAIEINTSSWEIPQVFRWLQKLGNIEQEEMMRTFNCGIGMAFCVSEKHLNKACSALEDAGEAPAVIGKVVPEEADSPALTYR